MASESQLDEARRAARAFLAATSEGVLKTWRAMPSGWTRAGDVRNGVPLSTWSTHLTALREVGAVERKRGALAVYYRPKRMVKIELEASL